MRRQKTMLKSSRLEKVGVGQVVTVNSAVVGDGRRIRRCGAVVSILPRLFEAVATGIAQVARPFEALWWLWMIMRAY